MDDLTLVKDVVTIVGVIAGFSYYFLTIRNQNKNQQLVSVYNMISIMRDKEMYRNWYDMLDYEWIDFDDFSRKYKTSEQEPEWMPVLNYFDSIGILWKKGVVNLEDLSSSMSFAVILLWRKFKPIIEAHRMYYQGWFSYFEEFAEAVEAKYGDRTPYYC